MTNNIQISVNRYIVVYSKSEFINLSKLSFSIYFYNFCEKKKLKLKYLTSHQDVSRTASHVNHRAFFSETKAGRDRQHNRHRFDQEGPFAQVTSDDEPAENGLDFGNAGSASIGSEHSHEAGG